MTLRDWCGNLERQWSACVADVGEGTAKVWGLYMAACRLGFERNTIQLFQVLGSSQTTTATRRSRCVRGGPAEPRAEQPRDRRGDQRRGEQRPGINAPGNQRGRRGGGSGTGLAATTFASTTVTGPRRVWISHWMPSHERR